MEKNNILKMIIDKLVGYKLIEGVYLEKNDDPEDNLYLHIVLKKDNQELFIKKMNIIINEMNHLTFYKKIESFYDFHNYYFKFEDEIKLFLLVDIDNYEVNSEANILYNPHNRIKVKKFELTPEFIGESFNHISYLLDIFNTAYKVKDIVKAMRILNDVNKYMLRFFNYNYLPNKIYHNYRECLNLLPEQLKNDCIKIIKKLRIESLLECSKMMIVLLDDHLSKIPINIAFYVNIDYYFSVKRSIFSYQ